MDWRANMRKDAADLRDEVGRKVDVDMSLEAMKRRWSLYRQHWEREEHRLKELEELKVAFRIRLDEKRKMFEHLTPEEQTQFKESIRTFRHPKFSKGAREVILTDKENQVRSHQHERQKASQEGHIASVTSWLWSKLSQSIPAEYDSTILPPKPEVNDKSNDNDDNKQEDKSNKSVTYNDGTGYTTTNLRKRSFANRKNNCESDICGKNGERMSADNCHQSKRHYSSTTTSKPDCFTKNSSDKVSEVIKIDTTDFDPYEYVKAKASNQLQTRPSDEDGDTIGIAARIHKSIDYEHEAARLEVALDKVARRQQQLQMACFKSTMEPIRKYDDDDPDFKPVKQYFQDELNPLREVHGKKSMKEMKTKEIVGESIQSFIEGANPKKFLADGGEAAVKDGFRFRSEYKMNSKRVGALFVFVVGIFAVAVALEEGIVELSNPADEYMKQAYQEQATSPQNITTPKIIEDDSSKRQ